MEAYSYSCISLFENCPRAYQFKYIEGKEEAFTTIEQFLGHAVHNTLRIAYDQKKQGNDLNKKQFIDIFDGL